MPNTEPYGSGDLPVPYQGQGLPQWAPGQGQDVPDHGVFVGNTGAEDRYRLVARLGSGREGDVWAAEDRSQHPPQPCALKLLRPPTPSESQEQRRRWTEQREILLRLDHPGLAKVHDMFVTWRPHRAGQCSGMGPPPEDHQVYVAVMDLVRGRKLADVEATVPSDERLSWVAQVAAAVAYLHRQIPPVLHRDISPNNVVVPEHRAGSWALAQRGTTERIAVLVDFGLVRIDEVGKSAVIAATRGYCAPEVWNDPTTTSQASDVYSLAATACFALIGSTPSDPPTPPPSTLPPAVLAERLYQALAHSPNREEIVRTLFAMLDPVPARRPTAVALVVAVEGNTQTVPIHASQAATEALPAPVPAPPRHTRALLVLAGLVALLAAGLTASILTRPDEIGAPRNPISTTIGVGPTSTTVATTTITAAAAPSTTLATPPDSGLLTPPLSFDQAHKVLITQIEAAAAAGERVTSDVGRITTYQPSSYQLCSDSPSAAAPGTEVTDFVEWYTSVGGEYVGSAIAGFSSVGAAHSFVADLAEQARVCGYQQRVTGDNLAGERGETVRLFRTEVDVPTRDLLIVRKGANVLQVGMNGRKGDSAARVETLAKAELARTP